MKLKHSVFTGEWIGAAANSDVVKVSALQILGQY